MIVKTKIVSSFWGESISLTQNTFRGDEQSNDNTDTIISDILDSRSDIVKTRENFDLKMNFVFFEHFNFNIYWSNHKAFVFL